MKYFITIMVVTGMISLVMAIVEYFNYKEEEKKMNEDLKNQNFISVDGKTVINSYGNVFKVGDTVKHEDSEAGTITIQKFEPVIERNEIRVLTDKGYAHIDFINHV